ncbi:MAG: hypothetical protein ACYC9L_08190 [Sulfuricaulis sp.]
MEKSTTDEARGKSGRNKKIQDSQAATITEPRWPALVAMLALGGLYAALPSFLLVGGPRWLLLAVVSVLLVPTVIAHRRGVYSLNQRLGYVLNGVVTLAMIGSLLLLITALPAHQETPLQLLHSAGALWISNILVFASWYWRLDAGGPYQRDSRPGHTEGAFLFPQMTIPAANFAAGKQKWSPNFIDYLFLAFNTSTALSPADTPVLSRWAKILMMTQAMISLLVVVLLAARAINIL